MEARASEPNPNFEQWPSLPLESWQDTYATLHMWLQIIGKIRLKLSPPVNHWWHCALYVSPCGLTTSAMPYDQRLVEIEFDFINHQLHISTSDGLKQSLALAPKTVADFYQEVMQMLHSMNIDVDINTKPQEVPTPIPFETDTAHSSYDPESAHKLWRILASIEPVFEEFRGRFLGKSSPVNFYWGSLDIAVTRFSGRRAPARPGIITSEAYSHECISAGFWPGAGYTGPAFYSYTAPAPPGLADQKVSPGFYSAQLSEFLLPYDELRQAESPREALLQFLQSSYEAGANLGNWDRKELER